MKSNRKPTIGITMGDPKGIGPEIIQKALSKRTIHNICHPVLFGDKTYFDFKKAKKLTPKECGQFAGRTINEGASAALAGEIDAMVTAPISKENLNLADYSYPGHTEFLADLCQVKKVRMMFTSPRLIVTLATIHVPLKEVPSLLSVQSVFESIRLTDQFLRKYFRIKKPKIAVAALNPHAGESKLFGREEKTKILPAIKKGRAQKIEASGPYPSDTLFWRAVNGEFDAVIAMYHDQGLIPLKLLHFDSAVNITVGLPFIRTSVDHGTAFDIAGKGMADETNMVAAIKMAVRLCK